MSADGRWAYTLYSSAQRPFVHALDTVGNTARCIDLDALTKRNDLFQMKLRLARGGEQLQIVKAKNPVMLVDTHSKGLVIPIVFARDLASSFKQDPSRVRSG